MKENYSIIRNTLTIVAMLCFVIVSAQYNEGTIYFKDSTSSQGLIKIRMFGGGIKFKPDNDSEAVNYNNDQIYGYDIKNNKYRYEKYGDAYPAILLMEELNGKIILYSDQITSPGLPMNNGMGMGMGMGFGGGTTTIYYIKVNNQLIRIGTRISRNHMKMKFFNDCPSLVKKIEKRELKRRDVYKIIEFYNQNCH